MKKSRLLMIMIAPISVFILTWCDSGSIVDSQKEQKTHVLNSEDLTNWYWRF